MSRQPTHSRVLLVVALLASGSSAVVSTSASPTAAYAYAASADTPCRNEANGAPSKPSPGTYAGEVHAAMAGGGGPEGLAITLDLDGTVVVEVGSDGVLTGTAAVAYALNIDVPASGGSINSAQNGALVSSSKDASQLVLDGEVKGTAGASAPGGGVAAGAFSGTERLTLTLGAVSCGEISGGVQSGLLDFTASIYSAQGYALALSGIPTWKATATSTDLAKKVERWSDQLRSAVGAAAPKDKPNEAIKTIVAASNDATDDERSCLLRALFDVLDSLKVPYLTGDPPFDAKALMEDFVRDLARGQGVPESELSGPDLLDKVPARVAGMAVTAVIGLAGGLDCFSNDKAGMGPRVRQIVTVLTDLADARLKAGQVGDAQQLAAALAHLTGTAMPETARMDPAESRAILERLGAEAQAAGDDLYAQLQDADAPTNEEERGALEDLRRRADGADRLAETISGKGRDRRVSKYCDSSGKC